MKLSKLGEFGLIDRIYKKAKNKDVLVGIGDDAAIIKAGNKLLAITTDTLVEGDHFSFEYFTPKQVGKKAIEINVSDIGAMGGIPKYALVSLVLPKDLEVGIIEKIYKGMRESGDHHKLDIIGGNITHGTQLVIDIDMIGEVKKENLCLRSHAKPGDFIIVTGDLGASTAGLNIFRNKLINHNYVKQKHIEPKAKLNKVKPFLKYINAMIDVSDGLASEVKHICEQSKTGAVIYTDNIPIKDETRDAAKAVKKEALDYALYGGEDFELVFTVEEKNLNKVKGFLVGEITKKKGVYLYSKGKKTLLSKKGYDHFNV
ncbi:MAG: thiamine-phosphate kinase [Nanoarchaeota archaeon]|nr:thiamine-phosphate kinase [Nanoarchaeota archaeon]MBU1945363.1 thiamine-phosphate kinase [Nanoarchaeota archaeon]